MYERGIMELRKGISVDCSSHKGEVWERAQKLQDKMKTNMKMAQERLKFLGKENDIQFNIFVCNLFCLFIHIV